MSNDALVQTAVSAARPSSTGWRRGPCPFCELATGKVDRKQSLGVSARGYYNCFKCATSGWLKDAAPIDDAPPRVVAPLERIDWPEGFHALPSSADALQPAWQYLTGPHRRVDPRIIERAKIGACVKGYLAGRVVVPMFDEADELVWYVARSWVPKAEKPYLYPRGERGAFIYDPFGAMRLKQAGAPLLVMEGAFDALAHAPYAVAVLGKTTEQHVARLTEWSRVTGRRVVLVPDGDAYAEAVAAAYCMSIEGASASCVQLRPRTDPDQIGKREMLTMVYQSFA